MKAKKAVTVLYIYLLRSYTDHSLKTVRHIHSHVNNVRRISNTILAVIGIS